MPLPMPVEVRAEGELPPAGAVAAGGLDWLDGDLPYDAAQAERAARRGFPWLPPRSLYAVRGGAVVGKVGLLDLPFRTAVATHRILLDGRRPVGYFASVRHRDGCGIREAVVTEAAPPARLLDALVATAPRGWLAIGRTTFVGDVAAELRARGFTLWPSSHRVLMARSLGPSHPLAGVVAAARARRFSSHVGDVF